MRSLAGRDVECHHVPVKLQQNCALLYRDTDHHSPWQICGYHTLEQGERSKLDRDDSPPLYWFVSHSAELSLSD